MRICLKELDSWDASPRRRILLSEGSSLSARQAITILGLAGHHIEVCDPDPFCIGRFSRFVRQYHRCPGLGSDPAGYLAFLLELLKQKRFDALLPTHEQGYLLAKVLGRFAPLTGLALPAFEDYVAAHGKASFSRLLTELGLAQPLTEIISLRDLPRWTLFPAVIKTTIGTASRGVRFVHNSGDLERATAELAGGAEFGGEIVIQQLVSGPLERVQAVFCRGHLVGLHVYRQIAEGAGGGDKIKESVHRPDVRAHLKRLGERLRWHGALSADYILKEPEGIPLYIDCNPRLVEPVNAFLSGIDLAGLLVAVSVGEQPEEIPPSRAGIRTHMAIQSLMECTIRGGSRLSLLSEIWHLWRESGPYANSREELTPVNVDLCSLLPLSYVALRMLMAPGSAGRLARRTAQSHQLNQFAIKTILDAIDCKE
jgi:hypothetical protein